MSTPYSERWKFMARLTDVKRVIADAVPPIEVEVYDENDKFLEKKTFTTIKDTLNFIKEMFGSFRNVKMTTERVNSTNRVELVKPKAGKIVLTFKGASQTDLTMFFG